jgi:hypothetical protein
MRTKLLALATLALIGCMYNGGAPRNVPPATVQMAPIPPGSYNTCPEEPRCVHDHPYW